MKIAVLEVVLILALYIDLKYKKIPNIITLPGMMVALFLNYKDIRSSLMGLAIIMVAYIPVYTMGAIAAGDVKLIMVIGLMMGYSFTLAFILTSIILNFIVASFILMKKSKLKEVLISSYEEIKFRFLSFVSRNRKDVLRKPFIKPEIHYPYAPVIFAAVNILILIQYFGQLLG